MEKLSLRKDKYVSGNEEQEFKSEREHIKLNLRKKQINNIISSKRKLLYKIENDDEIKKQYYLDADEIQIPDEYKTDIYKFVDKVRIFYIKYIIKFFNFNFYSLISY